MSNSCIIDPNTGQPYQYENRRPARSANLGGGSRPSESRNLKDLDKLVPKQDRQMLVSASKTLYLNSQPLIGAIDQKAMYSVGTAWLPVYKGKDAAFGEAAKEWLEGEWYEICNTVGTTSDFVTDLYTASVGIDREGEWFEYFTATAGGYPQIQLIPSHRIDAGGLPEGQLPKGRYSGTQFWHEDGIVYWKNSMNPVAYSFCDINGIHEKFIDSAFVKHVFDKSWPEQKRGLPLFYHSLNGLRDILQSEEWERRTLLIMSRLTYTLETTSGGPDNDPDEPGYIAPSGCGQPSVQYLEGGTIQYVEAKSGEKLTQHQNFRPGNPWMDFNDYQVRLALMGINWPYSLWKPSGQGTAERHDIGKAVRAVDDRQALLSKVAKWRITKALAWAMANERIQKSSDWWNWGFTKPPKLTIDDGRSSKEKLEKFKAGILNATDLIGEEGHSYAETLHERGQEVISRMRLIKDLEQANPDLGPIDPRYFLMLTPNEQASTEEPATNTAK